jgi:hypothetical protein
LSYTRTKRHRAKGSTADFVNRAAYRPGSAGGRFSRQAVIGAGAAALA